MAFWRTWQRSFMGGCRPSLVRGRIDRRWAIDIALPPLHIARIRSYAQTATGQQHSTEKRRAQERKHRNLFLLKVHPDLFSSHPVAQRTNQHSLQKLNSLIRSVKGDDSLPTARVELEFYSHNQRERGEPSASSPPLHLQAAFEPPRIRNNRASAKAIRRAYAASVTRCLNSLFVQAGIVQPSEVEDAAHPGQSSREGAGHAWIKDVAWGSSSVDVVQRELVDMHLGSGDFKRATAAEETLALLDPDSVFFSPALSETQKLRGLRLFTAHMVELSYLSWMQVPVLITNAYTRRRKGFVSVPYNFDKDEMVGFLNIHLRDIQAEAKETRSSAQMLLELQREIRQHLQLPDISIWGADTAGPESIRTLRLVRDMCPVLKRHDWSGTNLVIHDCFALDPRRGRMILPRGADEDEVRRFVEARVASKNWPWQLQSQDAWLRLKDNYDKSDESGG